MSAAFTPGPWAFDDDDELVVSAVSATMIARAFSSADFPCLEDDERDAVEAECRANASLIAAAPELYEALALVCRTEVMLGGTRDAALAALAKARGDQP